MLKMSISLPLSVLLRSETETLQFLKIRRENALTITSIFGINLNQCKQRTKRSEKSICRYDYAGKRLFVCGKEIVCLEPI